MPQHSKTSFNYKLTKFFIERSRLTVLALVLLLIGGLGSIGLNTLTGFPAIDIKLIIVQTQYIGASSETVVDEITQPIESSLKGVEGIDATSSTSGNSFSSVVLTVEESQDLTEVKSNVQAQIDTLELPEDANDPRIFTPSTGGEDFVYAIYGNSREETYRLSQQFTEELESIANILEVEYISELKKQEVITLDSTALQANNLDRSQVQKALESQGVSIPLAQNVTVDDVQSSLIVSQPEKSLDEISKTPLAVRNAEGGSTTIQLGSIATISTEYFYESNDSLVEPARTQYSYRDSDDQSIIREATIIAIDAVEGSDLAVVENAIKDVAKESEGTFYDSTNIADAGSEELIISEVYSENKGNEEQVGQIVQGLFGGKIGDNPLGYLGFFLGAIQLVFLVMLLFVSWRSALIATISIPLSIFFASITLFLQGESLNFLVLFSTVLVIGLVVDPTLVILEAIQRKMDTGLKGKTAVLAAVQDVGDGLFSSTLTNIIVFVPFGIVSGFLGQIFGFIPATIIPAIIGSYFVALIFLSWLGSIFLKPGKDKSTDEEENIWPIAKWFIRTNTKILHGSRLFRLILIIVAIAIPVGVTSYMFSSEKVKSVQFSSEKNGEVINIEYEYLSGVSEEKRAEVNANILKDITNTDGVLDATPINVGRNNAVYVNLKPVSERGDNSDQNTIELADELNETLNDTYVIDNNQEGTLFDLLATAESTGGPTEAYQINLVVKDSNIDTLKAASLDLRNTALNVCKDGTDYSITEDCQDGERIITKVDDGFTNREGQLINIQIKPQAVIDNNLNLDNQELIGLIYGQLQARFTPALEESIEVQTNGVAITSNNSNPATVEEINNIVIRNSVGQPVQISTVADVLVETPKQSIKRVEGETVNQVNIRLNSDYAGNQGAAGLASDAILEYYKENDGEKAKEFGLTAEDFDTFSEGNVESTNRSFAELGISLLLAIFLIYAVLVVFFDSFTMPLVILFTIPLTFVGVFPGLAYIANGEFGFLETIGIIILAGLVVNVAIYLIDAAKQKMAEGMDNRDAIAQASGIRFRAVLLTNMTALASLAPLAFYSEFYRSISVTIIAGLTTSAITSLFTTPILFVFFQWLTRHFHQGSALKKILMFIFFPIAIIYLGIKDRPQKKEVLPPEESSEELDI